MCLTNSFNIGCFRDIKIVGADPLMSELFRKLTRKDIKYMINGKDRIIIQFSDYRHIIMKNTEYYRNLKKIGSFLTKVKEI